MDDPEVRHGFPFPPPTLAVSNAGLELSGTIARFDPDKMRWVRGVQEKIPREQQRMAEVQRLYTRVAGGTPPEVYEMRFRRWKATTDRLASVNDGFVTFTCDATGRLIVGLSDESVRETSIALQRLDGMPLIPGSALKGLVRRVAASRQFKVIDAGRPRHLEPREQAVLTGTQKNASYVTYFDAWYVPGTAKDDHPLRRDVMTPHHQRYNSSRGKEAPTDFEDPVPVPFLSATGSYRFAILGPTPEWSALAKAALLYGLEHWGIGAKTSSGYGRMIETA